MPLIPEIVFSLEETILKKGQLWEKGDAVEISKEEDDTTTAYFVKFMSDILD